MNKPKHKTLKINKFNKSEKEVLYKRFAINKRYNNTYSLTANYRGKGGVNMSNVWTSDQK